MQQQQLGLKCLGQGQRDTEGFFRTRRKIYRHKDLLKERFSHVTSQRLDSFPIISKAGATEQEPIADG
jgi:hypothetical protein